MKKKLLFVLALPLLLVGCNNSHQEEAGIHFETGYEDIVIEDVLDSTVSKPAKIDGMNVEGYYADEEFTQEFDFNKSYNEPTIIYVKGLKGAGTQEDPYIIESSNSFKSMAYKGSEVTGFYKVTKSFSIIEKYTDNYAATTFNGTLDGNGNTINLRTYLEDEVDIGFSDTGLLYKVGAEGSVKNLVIEGALNGNVPSVGSLANHNEGTIENIETYGISKHASNGYNSGVRLMTTWSEDGVIEKDFGRVGMLEDLFKGGAGGIVGTNKGIIKNSMNRMLVAATIGGGGIAGFNYGTIENCFNKGAVGTTGNNAVNSSQIRDHLYDFSYIGGISGANFGTVHQCGNMNQVFVARLPWKFNDNPVGQDDYINRIRVGGIAGYNVGEYDESANDYKKGIISECFNYGRVHGDMQVGGIAGYSSGKVIDCQAVCPIGARYCLGGIVGWMPGDNPGDRLAVVDRCYAMTRISAGSDGTFVDELGNSVPGVKLIQLSSTVTATNIVDYYHIAKYATNSIYHNYGGVDKPLNPATKEIDTNSTNTTATFSDESKRDVVAKVNGEDSGAWGSYISSDVASAIVGFNSSWQAYLNLVLKWQEKTIKFVKNGTTTEVKGVAGIDYVNTVVAKTSFYQGPLSSNYSCVCADRIPALAANEIWVTEEGNINTPWDGVLRNDITVYAMSK